MQPPSSAGRSDGVEGRVGGRCAEGFAKSKRDSRQPRSRNDVNDEDVELAAYRIQKVQGVKAKQEDDQSTKQPAAPPRNKPASTRRSRKHPGAQKNRIQDAVQRMPEDDENGPSSLQRADSTVAGELQQRRPIGLGQCLGKHAFVEDAVGESEQDHTECVQVARNGKLADQEDGNAVGQRHEEKRDGLEIRQQRDILRQDLGQRSGRQRAGTPSVEQTTQYLNASGKRNGDPEGAPRMAKPRAEATRTRSEPPVRRARLTAAPRGSAYEHKDARRSPTPRSALQTARHAACRP